MRIYVPLKTEAINSISDTGTYNSETQSAREENLEVYMVSSNSKQNKSAND